MEKKAAGVFRSAPRRGAANGSAELHARLMSDISQYG